MDEKLLKRTAMNSVIFMLTVVILSIGLSITDGMKISAEKSIDPSDKGIQTGDGSIDKIDDVIDLDKNIETNENLQSIIGDKYIGVELESGLYKNINVKELYMERKLVVTIENIEYGAINKENILRVSQGEEYKNSTLVEKIDEKYSYITLPYKNDIGDYENTSYVETISQNIFEDKEEILDPVLGYSIEYLKNTSNNTFNGIITFNLDTVYVPTLHQDKGHFFLSLKKPSHVFDTIIVIDAGHGGKDPGTHSVDRIYFEKDVNLDVTLYLKELLDKENIKVYYTRSKDETVYLKPRVEFANEVEADLFLSIHCNASESTKAYGSEVLYNENHSSNVLSSKDFADICLEEILGVTNRVNRGLVEASEMVVVGNANMPVALIEIGFMTNQVELDFLLKDSNKISIANALHRSIMRAIDILSIK